MNSDLHHAGKVSEEEYFLVIFAAFVENHLPPLTRFPPVRNPGWICGGAASTGDRWPAASHIRGLFEGERELEEFKIGAVTANELDANRHSLRSEAGGN